MSAVQRVAGVVVPAEMCPALSRLLRLGMQAARSNGYRVPVGLRDAVDAISSAGADAAMSPTRQQISPSDDTARRLTLSSKQVADVLGVDIRTVQRLAGSGELRGEQIANRWIFERTSVDEYKRKRG